MPHRHRRASLCAVLLAVTSLAACAQRARSTDFAPRAARIDSLMTALHAQGWFSGAVVVGRGDQILYGRGFGHANAAAGVPFTPRTPSDGGSLAKTMTAAALLILQQEGRLSLEDPVQRHLPEYPYPGTTVRHLITHAAGGLPDYDWFWEQVGGDQVLTNASLLEILRDRRPPLRYTPGARFHYDSVGFDLAAVVVERVAGTHYEAFLRERFWKPLGMEGIHIRPARFSDWPGVRTLSYRAAGDSVEVYDVFDREGFHGGSNVYLSAEDLYRWVSSFYARPVLGPEAMRAGLAPVLLSDGRATGISLLSWYASEDSSRFQYPGVLQGFYSVGYWDAGRGHSVAFVSNGGMPQWLPARLTAALATLLDGGTPEPVEPPDVDPLGTGYPASVAGAYEVPGVGRVSVWVEEEKPFLRVDDGPAYQIFRVDSTNVYVPGLLAHVAFSERGADGPRRIHWTTVFVRATGDRVPNTKYRVPGVR